MRVLPDLQASVICDDVRQERNGKFMLIGLFDVIALPRFPAVFQKLCVVNRWCCGEGAFRQHSRILKPDGDAVLVQGKEVTVRLPGGEATATSVELFLNVKFETEGTYWVEVMLESHLKLRYPVKVKKVAPPQKPAAGEG